MAATPKLPLNANHAPGWKTEFTRQADRYNKTVVLGGMFASAVHILVDFGLLLEVPLVVVLASLVPLISGAIGLWLFFSGRISSSALILAFYVPIFAFFPFRIALLTTQMNLVVFHLTASVVALVAANFSLIRPIQMAAVSATALMSYFLCVPFLGKYGLAESFLHGGLLFVIFTILLPVITAVRFRVSAENYRLRHQIEEQNNELQFYANNDHLTGTFNRRGGVRMLEQMVFWARRHRVSLTICYIDIDGLKKTNDQYGHAVGDELIVSVVEAVRRHIRGADTLCRLGGDEFMVIFPDCATEHVVGIMANVDDDLLRSNESHQHHYTMSISYGCAEYPQDGELSIDEFIGLADEQMYRRKNSQKEAHRGE